MAKKQKKIYSVTQISALIKSVLEGGLPSRMIITGQISGFKQHSSGHCYFSLKDEGAILPCVMWKSKANNMKFSPEDGMAVLATGHIDLYEPSGKYQFYADKLEPAGVGDLQVAFEQMVMRLAEQGLFSEEHKKPIPPYPMRIGLLTSASGAAVMDIGDSIYNRWPCAKLMLYAVPVQGEGAAKKIADALNGLNKRNKQLKLDVVIVGRGGGSLEDLWAFNEEVLARAIYVSDIPVISAVGHEVDMSIADLVADARASTPTKAGMIAVPDMEEVLQRLSHIGKRLQVSASGKLRMCSQQLETVRASSAFRNPEWLVNQAAQEVDESGLRLAQAGSNRFARLRESLARSAERVRR
ncbi:MAG: exodeoxyribonuclease VII large subunit, partial [Anaerohalosphaera sp.]|nr:exodeoxyribonuclease VII large subunit [Anaerohalosphaera sp.]